MEETLYVFRKPFMRDKAQLFAVTGKNYGKHGQFRARDGMPCFGFYRTLYRKHLSATPNEALERYRQQLQQDAADAIDKATAIRNELVGLPSSAKGLEPIDATKS